MAPLDHLSNEKWVLPFEPLVLPSSLVSTVSRAILNFRIYMLSRTNVKQSNSELTSCFSYFFMQMFIDILSSFFSPYWNLSNIFPYSYNPEILPSSPSHKHWDNVIVQTLLGNQEPALLEATFRATLTAKGAVCLVYSFSRCVPFAHT